MFVSLTFALRPCKKYEKIKPFVCSLCLPTDLSVMVDRIEVLLVRVGECEGVMEEGEGRMRECGPIGADPDRLVQQQELLDVSLTFFSLGVTNQDTSLIRTPH